MTTELLAFHGKEETKAFYVSRLEAHAAADELIQGTMWEGGKGCAVGCTLHNYDHTAYPKELGWPIWLARLEDTLFEGQRNEDVKEFPIRLTKAVPVGFTEAQFDLVKAKFFHWLLVDNECGVINFAKTDRTTQSIINVGALYQDVIDGKKVTQKQWRDAAADAADAAAYAADAAAAAAAAYAAADAAAYAAADAAAAAYTARKAQYKKMADKLVALFGEAAQ